MTHKGMPKKIIIVSDLHLSHRNFNDKQCQFLESLFGQYDQVIINGDFWCQYTSSFDQFIKSKWSILFPLLKSKNCIYIFGNHDPEEVNGKEIDLFCNTGLDSYELAIDQRIWVVTHGNQFSPRLDDTVMLKLLHNIMDWESVVRLVQNWIVKLISVPGHAFVGRVCLNRIQKKNIPDDGKTYIVGHTHAMEDDLGHKYINSGFLSDIHLSHVDIIGNTVSLKTSLY